MNTRSVWSAAALLALSPCVTYAANSDLSYPVAGLAPYQRPANAPHLTTPPALNAKQALHGVSEPVPASLMFLKDQGRWFNPFTHPGMPGPYDLRGWHVVPSPAADKK